MNESDKLQAYVSEDAMAAKQQLADRMIEGGAVPKGMSTMQAWAIIQKGHELGIPPTEALATMFVINGRITLEAEAMLGLIYNSGKCDGLPTFEIICADEPDRQGWAVTMRRKNPDGEHRETFTMEDAKRVKVMEKDQWITLDQKAVWKSYPRIMLRWRAIAACARIVFADVIGGMYTPEEIGAPVTVVEDGTVRVIASRVEDEEPDETADQSGIDDDSMAEAYELGDLRGYSAAKIRTEVDKAGREHIGDLLAEWQVAVDAKPYAGDTEEYVEGAGFEEPSSTGSERRLIPEAE